jgi:Mitochondrial PGP phosphatase
MHLSFRIHLPSTHFTPSWLLRTHSLALALHSHVASDIRSLPFVSLKQAGITGVVFDKDNTLTAPFANTIYPSLTVGASA